MAAVIRRCLPDEASCLAAVRLALCMRVDGRLEKSRCACVRVWPALVSDQLSNVRRDCEHGQSECALPSAARGQHGRHTRSCGCSAWLAPRGMRLRLAMRGASIGKGIDDAQALSVAVDAADAFALDDAWREHLAKALMMLKPCLLPSMRLVLAEQLIAQSM